MARDSQLPDVCEMGEYLVNRSDVASENPDPSKIEENPSSPGAEEVTVPDSHCGGEIEGEKGAGRMKKPSPTGGRERSHQERDRPREEQPPPIGNRFNYVAFHPELLGKVIRDMRRLRGLTRKQLAEATEISESYLGSIETGAKIAGKDRNASFLILNKIAERLKIPTHWLLLLAEEGGQESDQGRSIDAAIVEVKNKIKLHIFLESEKIEDAVKLIS
jgi:transcriptional regulator with XRE-family HTH domain